MNRKMVFLMVSILLLAFMIARQASAQDHADAAAQANNPLANMTAFNIQDYYIGELTESDDSANQFWLRYAQPFSVAKTNWLMRASLPVNTYPTHRRTGVKIPASAISMSLPPI